MVGFHYFPPGLWLLSQQREKDHPPWPPPNYTAWWQRHTGVSGLPQAPRQWCPARLWTRNLNHNSVDLPIAQPHHLFYYYYFRMVTIGDNITKIRSHMDVGQELYWLGFWVKGQGHNRWWPRKPCECNIFITIGANFTKIRSHMYLSLETYLSLIHIWRCRRRG